MEHVNPSREQFDAFKALPRDTPILMLNLVRLKDEAVYPEGERVSGAEAYARYGRHSEPVFQRLGGTIVWRGTWEGMVIGPDDKRWDIAFVARYPTAAAFLAMVTDPEYKAAVIHRTVAVEDSRLIRFGEAAAGAGFAG